MIHSDTIFALSSGRPPAAIAVVRISGPCARFGLETLIGRVPEPRHAVFVKVRDPESREIIDEGLVLWFPGPKSETGEDVVELQLHGGQAVVASILAALARLPEFRMAEPGEFTRRAFENGKLDLTAVEGLADLIYAETDAQRRQAYRQLKGFLGERAETWRGRLIEALALVEARIDFSDEADVPEGLIAPALDIARALCGEIAAALADGRRGERLREGLTIAIAGPPNAGKSSLFNRIVRRDAAIVTSIPGTTRDVIEVHLDIGGFPVTLLDTAGIRDTEDPIEREGVRRAGARAEAADLVLWVCDATEGPNSEAKANLMGLDLDRAGGEEATPEFWVVRNKIDLVDSEPQQLDEPPSRAGRQLRVSARTGEGLEELMSALAAFSQDNLVSGESQLITRERHRGALTACADALRRAQNVDDRGEEILAQELRFAANALGRLTGRVDAEDILDRIFRDFCIGK
jgi:tRNA modification GTPase